MVDSRLIEETATLVKELSSGWAKDGRGHLREEAAHKRFNLQFFSTMISGLWLLGRLVKGGRLIGRRLMKFNSQFQGRHQSSFCGMVCGS